MCAPLADGSPVGEQGSRTKRHTREAFEDNEFAYTTRSLRGMHNVILPVRITIFPLPTTVVYSCKRGLTLL